MSFQPQIDSKRSCHLPLAKLTRIKTADKLIYCVGMPQLGHCVDGKIAVVLIAFTDLCLLTFRFGEMVAEWFHFEGEVTDVWRI